MALSLVHRASEVSGPDELLHDLEEHIECRPETPHSREDLHHPSPYDYPYSKRLEQKYPSGLRRGTVLVVHRAKGIISDALTTIVEMCGGHARIGLYDHVFMLLDVDEDGKVNTVLDFDPVFDGHDGPVTAELVCRIIKDAQFSQARILRGSQIDDNLKSDEIDMHPTIQPPEPDTPEFKAMEERINRALTCEWYCYSVYSFSCDSFCSYIVYGPEARSACPQVRNLYDSLQNALCATAPLADDVMNYFKAVEKQWSTADGLWESTLVALTGAIGIFVGAVLVFLFFVLYFCTDAMTLSPY